MGAKGRGGKQTGIRVGVVSRFLYKHMIGYMVQGVVEMLPRPKFRVLVFRIEPRVIDEVSNHIDTHSDEVFALPGTLNLCADIVREQRLDVLIYPEVGLDPVTYFLTFSRLAPVQVAWWGHPDTTGVPTIDYFVSSSIETDEADQYYSERLLRLSGLGAFFHRPRPKGSDPLVIRDQIRIELNLPRNFHFYLCPQALFKFHPAFDDVLVEILAKDKLAYFLLLDGRDRHAWTKLLLQRMKAKMNADHTHRILFYKVDQDDDMTSLYQASDVVLDTFPAGGYITSLQAFAVGAPVITLPGELLASRFTYAMYTKMEITDCIATDPKHFVSLALKVAYNKNIRKRLVSLILARNHRLFNDEVAVEEWDDLLTLSTYQDHDRRLTSRFGLSRGSTDR